MNISQFIIYVLIGLLFIAAGSPLLCTLYYWFDIWVDMGEDG